MNGEGFFSTRVALHAVCEHVLAAALHQATGHIGLRVSADGFATPAFGADDRVISVGAGRITVTDRRGTGSEPLTTLRAAARFVGIEPGAPAAVYSPATSMDPDAVLAIKSQAAEAIIDWYTKISSALKAFAPDSRQTLWPEHFDIAIRKDDCNFGGLAGDGAIADPYVYVGPSFVPPADPFFARPFGAARTWMQAPGAVEIAAFFAEGARRAHERSLGT